MSAFRWTFEVEVSEDAVADGLDFERVTMLDALQRAFPLVSGDTFEVQVTKKPSTGAIREIQGYDDRAHGFTFADWLDAAGRSDSASEYDLRAAWRAGEDPAEYQP